jgi:predicted house-cleaning NTP pyrophosphatase (Maf/HAM1 superfamily)
MSGPDFIYLASQSPRRRQLLDQLGVRHDLLVPAPGAEAEAAEALEAVQPGETPADYVQRVTALKLRAAGSRHAACRARPSCAATPRWRSAGASWASRPMPARRGRCCWR